MYVTELTSLLSSHRALVGVSLTIEIGRKATEKYRQSFINGDRGDDSDNWPFIEAQFTKTQKVAVKLIARVFSLNLADFKVTSVDLA